MHVCRSSITGGLTGQGSRPRILVKAIPADRQPFANDDAFGQGALSVLAQRIQAQRRSKALAQVRCARPELPKNVKMMDEVAADHKLICNWHENAWSQLKEVMDN